MYNTRYLRPIRLISSLLCVGFTLYRVQVSISTFAEDSSVTSIGYKEFLSKPGYSYPALTLCLEKPGFVREIENNHEDFTGTVQKESTNATFWIDQIKISSSFSYDSDSDNAETQEYSEFILNQFLQDSHFWCFTKTLKPSFKVSIMQRPIIGLLPQPNPKQLKTTQLRLGRYYYR